MWKMEECKEIKECEVWMLKFKEVGLLEVYGERERATGGTTRLGRLRDEVK